MFPGREGPVQGADRTRQLREPLQGRGQPVEGMRHPRVRDPGPRQKGGREDAPTRLQGESSNQRDSSHD